MGSTQKLSEAIAVVGHKKDAIENLMRQMMSELEDVSARAVSELESKEKHSMEVVKSVQASYALLNSKKRWLEEGQKKMDEKVKFVGRALQQVEEGKVQSRVVRDFIDQQLKELTVKEKQIQELSEGVRLTLRDVGEKKHEMESRQKQVEARKLAICYEQETLKKMKEEMDAERKRLESRKASLVDRESLIAFKEKTLLERESEFALKQKTLESELESREAFLVVRETLISSKELDIETRGKLLENLMKSKVMRDSTESNIQQPDLYAKGVRTKANRRGFGDGSAGEDLAIGSQRRDGKRPCSGDGVTEHKARRHPQQSGSDGKLVKLQTKRSEELAVLDDSGSNSEVRADSVLKDTQKGEVVRCYNVGETWACVDANDRMPRRYLKIIGVTEKRGEVGIEVEWMKPFARHPGEKDWILAGLPVGCGTFAPGRRSIEHPYILFQPMLLPAWNPCSIVPFIGETWAIYKDWDIKQWSSRPHLHRSCKYEIVEILPSSEAAYLDRLGGSASSFKRRSTKEEDSFLISPNSLYRFSHKVPSLKNSEVFELEQNALPPGLR